MTGLHVIEPTADSWVEKLKALRDNTSVEVVNPLMDQDVVVACC